MASNIDRSFIGVGKVWAKTYGSTAALRHIGNVSKIQIKHALQDLKQPDYTRGGGGTYFRKTRIQSATVDMSWLAFSAENFALATGGVSTEVTGATATDELRESTKGTLVKLTHPPAAITSVAPVITGTAYVAGTDYQLTAGGIFIPSTSNIPNATPGTANIKVTYTYTSYDRIEAATTAGAELYMFVEGMNDANDLKPVLTDLWRASIPPAAQVDLIGLDLGSLDVSAELLKDATKGAGVSALYRTLMGQ